MKTEIVNEETQAPDFPALYKSISGMIVLMIESGKGVIIESGRSSSSVGRYDDNFIMDLFTKITTDITIKFKAGG